ncbi:SDR family NAD(P)-dependent oxidoreductase [Phaeobacter sp. 22II1-1F12B]|uniref:SDR family NAD(P)-dependent oxidoreductase n=1 Tax=Phaeobacter sp. 22II1-1F12B TaxID=1317111 RepID=UPI000B5259CE|nr:SDR family oxidoreductase [Phaeobacter sp. 22II1-1F12B]
MGLSNIQSPKNWPEPSNSDALCLTCDVADQRSVEAAVSYAAEVLGGVDVLVNNAGYPVTDLDTDMSDAKWRGHFEADVHGLHYVTEAARSWLEAEGGAVVNTTSVAGLGGDRAMEAYDAAKGAAVQLTRALAIDFAPKGVRVNAVCPTLTHTAMSRAAENQPEKLEAFLKAIPLRRVGEPEEVAAAILFLASGDASFITGVALAVDGGITAGNGQPHLV